MAKIIVAHSEKNKVIGNKGKLPWKIKEEMKFFSGITEHGQIILGSKTYTSIRPSYWTDKIAIVLSRTSSSFCKNLKGAVYTSLEKALSDNPRALVIGGESIYNQCLSEELIKHVDSIICSVISDPTDAPYTGDAYFNHDLNSLNFSERLSKKTSWGHVKYYEKLALEDSYTLKDLSKYLEYYK